MASSDAETFIQHPLILDPSSKAISAPSSTSSSALTDELESLNQLHRALISLDGPTVPPPPRPVNPKRSAQISKLRDTANAAYRKGTFPEAVKLYTYAIDMALGRPGWEPVGLVREELSGLYANRSQAYMSQQLWAEAWVDAKTSLECAMGGNAKAWWRGGKSLVEMGRYEEAGKWIRTGVEVEGKTSESGKELAALLEDAEKGMERTKSG
ncbi:hypothetical protein AJ80_03645 [Polytolypa hystricis UAMH7299]|uniref:Translocation protein sec72 n=1 Tax=Polytolypa hystricis (strain UAMH7299) TaxID=1447883 RepID=A0A2B7YIE0_POLH7|nr:hypothetical protein AJ80_03645 [Polytolypa hystricis UAMH7299]